MNNRFVKNNFWLLTAVSVCSLVALGLLIFTLVEYVQMYMYITKVEDFRQQIGKIIKQKPAPVEGNKKLIRQDIDLYRKVASELRMHFGRPMQPAVDKFFSVLKARKGAFGEDSPETLTQERFMEEFHKQWDSIDQNDYPRQKYFLSSEFQPKFVNWSQAQAEFIRAAQPYTLEPLTTDNADEVLFSALGIPRRLSGDSARLTQIIGIVREQLLKELGEQVQIAQTASGLGFGSVVGADGQPATTYSPDEIPVVLAHLGIVSDMLRRIKDSGIKTVYDIRIRRGGEGGGGGGGDGAVGGGDAAPPAGGFQSSVESSGSYQLYHYQLEVSGTMADIRKMAALLDNAYGDRRVYLVRTIFLYAEENGAAALFGVGREENPDPGLKNQGPSGSSDGPVVSRRSRRGRRVRIQEDQDVQGNEEAERKRRQEEALRRYQEQQARLPYERRDGYGEVLIGAGETYRAVIDIEYVALSGR